MFFPCTSGEEVKLDSGMGHYLDQPTVLFCNPNALLY